MAQWLNVHLPPLTSCRLITPKDDRDTTLYTQWITPSVTVVRNLSAYACFHLHMNMVLKSEAEIFNFSKRRDAQGYRRFASDSQVCKQMSGSDPRTGMFPQRGLPWGIYRLYCERGTTNLGVIHPVQQLGSYLERSTATCLESNSQRGDSRGVDAKLANCLTNKDLPLYFCGT